jgi:hypothetical protein
MHRGFPAVTLAALPLLWSLVFWAAWHFWVVPVLFPLSLGFLAFPACLGYAAVLATESPTAPSQSRSSTRAVAFLSMVMLTLAYACALYAWVSILGILPEHYKFNSSAVSLSKRTVELWAGLSLVASIGALFVHRAALPGTLSRKLATAAVGMACPTAALFSIFLAAGLVSYRP